MSAPEQHSYLEENHELRRQVEELKQTRREQDRALRELLQQRHVLPRNTEGLYEDIQQTARELADVIRERNLIEAALKVNREYYRSLFDGSPTAYWLQDFSEVKRSLDELQNAGVTDVRAYFESHPQDVETLLRSVKVVSVNQAAIRLYKGTSEEDLLEGLSRFKPDLGDHDFIKQLVVFAAGKEIYESETTNVNLLGEPIHIALRKAVVPGFESDLARIMVSITDITERVKAERKLQESVREKEILLGEIHHRVKNNLQIISSLLDLGRMESEQKNALELLDDARTRIHTMALIHSQLYSSSRFDSINMTEHVTSLINYLAHTYASKGKQITIEVEPSDVDLTVNQAIPCALLINELVSNSFKYAFADQDTGTIHVGMRREEGGRVVVRVKDNGRGFPPSFDLKDPQSLGLRLVRSLVERQLKGSLKVIPKDGTETIVQFTSAPPGETVCSE